MSYLVHHGIKGQKWGVKNGPPYPLGASDHSASERKAGWKSSINKNDAKKNEKKNGLHLTDKQKKVVKDRRSCSRYGIGRIWRVSSL